MKLTDLTIMELSGLRAVFLDLIKQSAPLVQHTLKKMLQCINDAEDVLVERSKQNCEPETAKDATMEDIQRCLQRNYMDFIDSCIKANKEHRDMLYEALSQSDVLKEYNPSEHEINPKSRYIPKIMFDAEFWVKYEADLAKELSIVYAKQGIDPIEAVGKAKKIVRQLKDM